MNFEDLMELVFNYEIERVEEVDFLLNIANMCIDTSFEKNKQLLKYKLDRALDENNKKEFDRLSKLYKRMCLES